MSGEKIFDNHSKKWMIKYLFEIDTETHTMLTVHTMLLDEVIDDINSKCNAEIAKLRELGIEADRKYNHALARGYFERSNELENMKRMLNHYSETGEIKIPD